MMSITHTFYFLGVLRENIFNLALELEGMNTFTLTPNYFTTSLHLFLLIENATIRISRESY